MAFSGVRGKKSAFKVKLLDEAENNIAELKNIDDLEKKAETVFGETPIAESIIKNPDFENILILELAPILKKKVIGKDDVDIAAMIQKLGNSDWVNQGRAFYDVNDNYCPFCQQKIELSFTDSLNAYFNETFQNDVDAIDALLKNYKSSSELLQHTATEIMVDTVNLYF